MTQTLSVTESPIPGLFVVQTPVHTDSRGWFKENWQNETLTQLGLPHFKPVQNNISFNEKSGTTRGIHAEPWDKYVSVDTGRVFGAWVDLREGESFGRTFSIEIDPSVAVFIPRGVGNSYQTLEPNTSYNYLVNAHWSPTANYTFLNLADETSNINWPISLKHAEISEKDQNSPRLKDVVPFKPKKTVILGANGQLGKALQIEFPEAIALTKTHFDLANTNTWTSIDWNDVDTILNAAAYTKVDEAETPEGRKLAWAINVTGVGTLAEKCEQHDITLVHISSDYVFDGTKDSPYTEEDPFSPLGVYGQTKAAGDILVARNKKHYIIRTSWVFGDGPGFASTILQRLESGLVSQIVDDQVGRPTFTSEIARAINFMVSKKLPTGTYNLSGSGPRASWFEVAKKLATSSSHKIDLIQPISTENYQAKQIESGKAIGSPRPFNSELSLDKLKSFGFEPVNWEHSLT